MGNREIYNLLILLPTILSISASITFKTQTPDVVVVGSNLTFAWTYTDIDPNAINFGFSDQSGGDTQMKTLARYLISSDALYDYPDKPYKDYCSSVEWSGKPGNMVASFTMVNVSYAANEKKYGVSFTAGSELPKLNFAPKKLSISIPPSVELSVSNTNVTVGDLITIMCKVTKGTPEISYSWYRNGVLLEGKKGRYLFEDQQIAAEDNGEYKCTAKNDAGQETSSSLAVTVHKIPGKDDKTNTNERKDGKISNGSVLGIVFGLLAVLIVAIIIGLIWLRHRRLKAKSTVSNHSGDVEHEGENGNLVHAKDETRQPMVQPTQKDQVWL